MSSIFLPRCPPSSRSTWSSGGSYSGCLTWCPGKRTKSCSGKATSKRRYVEDFCTTCGLMTPTLLHYNREMVRGRAIPPSVVETLLAYNVDVWVSCVFCRPTMECPIYTKLLRAVYVLCFSPNTLPSVRIATVILSKPNVMHASYVDPSDFMRLMQKRLYSLPSQSTKSRVLTER